MLGRWVEKLILLVKYFLTGPRLELIYALKKFLTVPQCSIKLLKNIDNNDFSIQCTFLLSLTLLTEKYFQLALNRFTKWVTIFKVFHQKMYSLFLLIETYFTNPIEIFDELNKILTVPHLSVFRFIYPSILGSYKILQKSICLNRAFLFTVYVTLEIRLTLIL